MSHNIRCIKIFLLALSTNQVKINELNRELNNVNSHNLIPLKIFFLAVNTSLIKKINELNCISFKSELNMVNSHNLIPLKIFLLAFNTSPVKISKLSPFLPNVRALIVRFLTWQSHQTHRFK